WKEYLDAAREAVAEGIVMLENNGALPLAANSEVAVFGRIQDHYYKSGTGSGGMVNVSKVWSIPEGLEENGIKLNAELRRVYADWEKENPIDVGVGWGGEPWSQKEMPVSMELAQKIAAQTDTAVCIIGRTAGEEQDVSDEAGSYRLTDIELDMLKTVRAAFKKMVVLLNVGGIIDMTWMEQAKPDAVLYVWQGGMVGGLGTADVLTGKTSPSGKLSDTIAANVSDYPSAPCFGDPQRNFYCEDIYVGYRWFETFNKDAVLYPFGFGLSYTEFEIKASCAGSAEKLTVNAEVTNVGSASGKQVVEVYLGAPQGKLGKPAKVLCAYAKTKTLAPAEKQTLELSINPADFASYDDSGVTGNKSCFVLEAGDYAVYVGSDVRSAANVGGFCVSETVVTERLSEALAPVLAFERVRPENVGGVLKPVMESVPTATVDMDERRLANLPAELAQTGDKGIKLADVVDGKHSMDEFIAQLSDDDLVCIVRGEGMGSPKVTAGTASAFGGVSDGLVAKGIPCGCCDDGPSGMRLDVGTKAFSLPNGTLLACTFNTELQERLYALTGIEVAANNVECLLGPGINIHRHPLNGRNFEYFSEDPYLTGTSAAAQVRGLVSGGVTGTIKHFCGNNQETGRHVIDSVISERALREIYLKGFEIAIKQGGAKTVMTTYGSLNGL
ncbi:MAG: glycoside hydrolase family 3 C-terminal domain-containing protein, partial [Oscillospiraceae bacterium]